MRKAEITMRLRILVSIGCLLALAGAAGAQAPAPVPAPAPPSPPVAPTPPAAPFGVSSDSVNADAQAFTVQMRARMNADAQRIEAQILAQERALAAGSASQDAQERLMALKDQLSGLQSQIKRGDLFAQSGQVAVFFWYQRGQSALDGRRWDEALNDFTQVATKGGDRADGALYWKAYVLNKLGRRDDALAAIAELRKSYAASRWLDDAKALELEVKQANGQPVSPESQTDEDLKLMALNGLMESDPDRAIPAVENLLKGAQPPRLKERALYVLAQSSSPKAQQIVEQVARGGAGNPDLQVKAITYLGAAQRGIIPGGQGRETDAQVLFDIYKSSNDINVKRAILNSPSVNRDSDRLLQIAKTEKTPELRADAVRRLLQLRVSDPAPLMAIYSADQDKNVKRAIVDGLYSQNNVKAIVAAARAERDPEMVRYIVGRLASMKSPEAADYLMEILKK
jgi:hypothetical protein